MMLLEEEEWFCRWHAAGRGTHPSAAALWKVLVSKQLVTGADQWVW